MMWMLPVAGAAIGALQGNSQRNQQQKYNQGQAELHKYSPWTGMRGEVKPVTASGFGGALQGGLTGASLAQSFGGFGGGGAATEAASVGKTGARPFQNFLTQ